MGISFCFSSPIYSNKLAPPGIQTGLERARFLLHDQLAEAGMTFWTSLPFSPQSLRWVFHLITMNQWRTMAEQRPTRMQSCFSHHNNNCLLLKATQISNFLRILNGTMTLTHTLCCYLWSVITPPTTNHKHNNKHTISFTYHLVFTSYMPTWQAA